MDKDDAHNIRNINIDDYGNNIVDDYIKEIDPDITWGWQWLTYWSWQETIKWR